MDYHNSIYCLQSNEHPILTRRLLNEQQVHKFHYVQLLTSHHTGYLYHELSLLLLYFNSSFPHSFSFSHLKAKLLSPTISVLIKNSVPDTIRQTFSLLWFNYLRLSIPLPLSSSKFPFIMLLVSKYLFFNY